MERRPPGRSRLRARHRAGAPPHRPRARRVRDRRFRADRRRGACAHRRHRRHGARERGAHRGGRPDRLRPAARRPGAAHRRPALSRRGRAGDPGSARAAQPGPRRHGLPARGGCGLRDALRHDAGRRADRFAPARAAGAALPLPQRRRLDAPLRDSRSGAARLLRAGARGDAVRKRADRGGVAFAARRAFSGTRRRSATR